MPSPIALAGNLAQGYAQAANGGQSPPSDDAPTITGGQQLSPTTMLYLRQLAEQHASQGGACPLCGQQAATSPEVDVDQSDIQRLASK